MAATDVSESVRGGGGDGKSVASESDEALYLEDELADDDHDDDALGANLEDLDEIGEGVGYPSMEDWKDVPAERVSVSIGEAVHENWQQAHAEVELLRQSFLRRFDTRSPSLRQLVNYIFRPSSAVYRVFSDQLMWTHKEFCGFVATHFVQCLYRLSVAELYNGLGFLKQHELMDKEEYTKKWKQVGNASLPDDQKAAPTMSQ